MGQQILLSEEEKKNIQEMYGLINEQDYYDTNIIDNKNPYRHREFLKFLRPYDKSFGDGEKFYTIDDSIMKGRKFRFYVNDEMKKLLDGKTIRISDNEVLTIGKNCEFRMGNFEIEDILNGNNTIGGFVLDGSFRFGNRFFKNIFCGDDNLCFYSNGETSNINDPNFNYSNPSDKEKKQWVINLNNFIENEMRKIIENSPDEYWELREVNKKQTDFK